MPAERERGAAPRPDEGRAAAPDRSWRDRTFRLRSIDVRSRYARRFSQLSAAALITPVIAVFGVGPAADALGIGDGAWGAFFFEAGQALFSLGIVSSVIFALLALRGGAGAGEGEGDADLVIDGELVSVRRGGARLLAFRRAEVESGYARVDGRGVRVTIDLADGRQIGLTLRSRRRAEALLAALGAGPDQRRARVSLGSPLRPLAAGCLAMPVACGVWFFLVDNLARASKAAGDLTLPILVVFIPASVLLARRVFGPREVIIGADAVRLRGPFRRRTIRLDSIKAARAHGALLVLDLIASTEVVLVPCADAALAEALAHRIEQTRREAGRSRSDRAVADLLAPRDRSVTAWREALAALLRAPTEYRRAPVSADDVLTVLDDSAAPPALRIGAALALREAGMPEARERMRIAAVTSADDEVAAALEAAASDEVNEAAIRRAMRR